MRRLSARNRTIHLSGLLLAAGLAGCLADPEAAPATRSGAESSSGSVTTLFVRVVVPDSSIGRMDSAEVRLTGTGRMVRAPMAIADSVLEAEIGPWEPGPAELEVLAFAAGSLAYYGKAALDPDREGETEIRMTLGPVGRVRVDAVFAPTVD